MALQEDTLGQSIFMNSADMVPTDHISRLVAAIVDEIDVSKAEEKFVGTPGYPAYPRRMLLRLLVMAAIDGIESSRKIAKLTRENVIYIHLTGNMKPDFRTICAFRSQELDLVKETFKSVIKLADKLEMLDLGHLSTDGSIIKANASSPRTLSKKQIDWINEIVERGMQIDKEEDEKYGDYRGDQLPQELDSKEKILKKLKEIEEKEDKKLGSVGRKLAERHINGDFRKKSKVEAILKKASKELADGGQKEVNPFEPEARFMVNKKKRIELSYNVQTTVDLASGIIVSNDVIQDPVDCEQVVPQIEGTERNIGMLPEGTKISLDGGYHTGQNLRFLEDKKLVAYVPNKQQAAAVKGQDKGPYSKGEFSYDEIRDCFICPQGKSLPKATEYMYRGRMRYMYYSRSTCKECPVRVECAKGPCKSITSYGYEAERERAKLRLESPEGKEVYAKRKLVEIPFGDIKENQGFRSFITHGVNNARTEFNLQCLAHNIKRIWNERRDELKGINLRIARLERSGASFASDGLLAIFFSLFQISEAGCFEL